MKGNPHFDANSAAGAQQAAQKAAAAAFHAPPAAPPAPRRAAPHAKVVPRAPSPPPAPPAVPVAAAVAAGDADGVAAGPQSTYGQSELKRELQALAQVRAKEKGGWNWMGWARRREKRITHAISHYHTLLITHHLSHVPSRTMTRLYHILPPLIAQYHRVTHYHTLSSTYITHNHVLSHNHTQACTNMKTVARQAITPAHPPPHTNHTSVQTFSSPTRFVVAA